MTPGGQQDKLCRAFAPHPIWWPLLGPSTFHTPTWPTQAWIWSTPCGTAPPGPPPTWPSSTPIWAITINSTLPDPPYQGHPHLAYYTHLIKPQLAHPRPTWPNGIFPPPLHCAVVPQILTSIFGRISQNIFAAPLPKINFQIFCSPSCSQKYFMPPPPKARHSTQKLFAPYPFLLPHLPSLPFTLLPQSTLQSRFWDIIHSTSKCLPTYLTSNRSDLLVSRHI